VDLQIDEGLSEVIRRFSAEMADIENALRAFNDQVAKDEQRAAASPEQPRPPNLASEPQ
jgi:hypothetical protein